MSVDQTPDVEASPDVHVIASDASVEILDAPERAEAGEYQKKKLGLFFWMSVGWMGLLLFAALFAGFLPIKDPNLVYAGTRLQGPSAEHWFGSDGIGKDVFSRTIFGARRSLGIAFTGELIGFVLGGAIGLISGYYRGRIEGFLTGGIDSLLAFPALILALVLALFLGETELPVLQQIAGSPTKALIISLGILTIPTIARITRAGVLVNTEREYVLASRTLGTRNLRIMFREVLPNVLPAMVAYALIGVSFLIIVEAALSFLGVGDLNQPSWGTMINFARDKMDDAPHAVFFPALFLFLTVLSINYIGDRLRDYFDVREAAI